MNPFQTPSCEHGVCKWEGSPPPPNPPACLRPSSKPCNACCENHNDFRIVFAHREGGCAPQPPRLSRSSERESEPRTPLNPTAIALEELRDAQADLLAYPVPMTGAGVGGGGGIGGRSGVRSGLEFGSGMLELKTPRTLQGRGRGRVHLKILLCCKGSSVSGHSEDATWVQFARALLGGDSRHGH